VAVSSKMSWHLFSAANGILDYSFCNLQPAWRSSLKSCRMSSFSLYLAAPPSIDPLLHCCIPGTSVISFLAFVLYGSFFNIIPA
jgi:hypothetical protein